jgi:hypothetical protein
MCLMPSRARDPIYDRIWALRAERDAATSVLHWAEITRDIEEETGRIGRLLWDQLWQPPVAGPISSSRTREAA